MKVAVESLRVPRHGEQDNGDAVVVRRAEDDALVAVIDALGHGSRAASAATMGSSYLRDAVLGGTRGPAATVVRLPGVLGAQVSRCKMFDAKLNGRGRMPFFSAGLSGRMMLDDVTRRDAVDMCPTRMNCYRHPDDDATVLDADFEA